MGVYVVAHSICAHLQVVPSMALAVMGGVAGVVAVLLLLGVLERSAVYAQAGPVLQWVGVLALVLGIVWTLLWTLWPEKPETLPAAACVAALLWLWQGPAVATTLAGRGVGWMRVAGVLGVSCGLATFRADVACLLHVGVLGYTLAVSEPGLALRRGMAAVTALVAALGSAGMQFWLARVVYPQASYGPVKLWQLRPNVIHATRWPPLVIFLLPLVWMLAGGARRGLVRDPAGRAFLAGAVVYAALWATIGKVDEVRIFVPFAWALAPLMAQMVMERARRR
jgi:hypothetical protein